MTERLTKVESGLLFSLDATRAVDGDGWMEPVKTTHVKSCDFVVARDDGPVWFVEAKTSAPRPAVKDAAPGEDRLAAWCDEVCEKLLHTATTAAASIASRPLGLAALPSVLATALGDGGHWECVVVVTKCDDSWLPALRDVLREAIRGKPMWKLLGVQPEPRVLSRSLAVRMHLVEGS